LDVALGQSVFLMPNGTLFVELFVLAGAAVAIGALVDMIRTPVSTWKAVGKSKSAWVTLEILLLVFAGPVGLAMAVFYLATLRPKLRRITAGAI